MSEERRHICLGFTDERYPEGTHICYLYNDDEERRRILPLFARHALIDHECFNYHADVPDAAGLPDVMAELDLATAPTLKGGSPIPEAWDPQQTGVPY